VGGWVRWPSPYVPSWKRDLFHGVVEGAAGALVERSTGGFVGFEDFCCGPSDRLRVFTRNDDHAITVRHNHVTRANEYAADLDRPVHRLDFIPSGTDAATTVLDVQINRDLLFDDFVGIPNASIANDAHCAP